MATRMNDLDELKETVVKTDLYNSLPPNVPLKDLQFYNQYRTIRPWDGIISSSK